MMEAGDVLEKDLPNTPTGLLHSVWDKLRVLGSGRGFRGAKSYAESRSLALPTPGHGLLL